MNTPSGDEKTVPVYSSSERMAAAIGEARNRLPEFLRALAQPTATQDRFAVKYPFTDKTSGAVEHIWLIDVFILDDTFAGLIGSEVESIQDLRYGQPVRVLQGGISDWTYYDNGVQIGAFTKRALSEIQAAN